MGPPPGPVRRGVGSDTAWTGLPSCHDSFGMRSGWQKNCCQACVVWQQHPAVPTSLVLACAGHLLSQTGLSALVLVRA